MFSCTSYFRVISVIIFFDSFFPGLVGLFHFIFSFLFAVLLLAKLVAVAAATAKLRTVYDEKPSTNFPAILLSLILFTVNRA